MGEDRRADIHEAFLCLPPPASAGAPCEDGNDRCFEQVEASTFQRSRAYARAYHQNRLRVSYGHEVRPPWRGEAALEVSSGDGRFIGQRSASGDDSTAVEITAANGGLLAKGEEMTLTLAFDRDHPVLATDQNGQVHRADFIGGSDGRISWFGDGGRHERHRPKRVLRHDWRELNVRAP
jgi:hypothetical protein